MSDFGIMMFIIWIIVGLAFGGLVGGAAAAIIFGIGHVLLSK